MYLVRCMNTGWALYKAWRVRQEEFGIAFLFCDRGFPLLRANLLVLVHRPSFGGRIWIGFGEL